MGYRTTEATLIAALTALVVVAAYMLGRRARSPGDEATAPDSAKWIEAPPGPQQVPPPAFWDAGLRAGEAPGLPAGLTRVEPDVAGGTCCDGIPAAFSRLYSAADVDPLVTGQQYAHAGYMRNVYASRTSHGDSQGLTEYSSAGAPGDVGVDVGPYGLDEYGGRSAGFDDGIPAEWLLPSTPIRWYRPRQRDYYGAEGPTPYTEGLYPLTEPDHDPYVGGQY